MTNALHTHHCDQSAHTGSTACRGDAPSAGLRRERIALVIASFVLALIGLAWFWLTLQPSSASFSDQEVLAGNRLGAGTLDISIGNETVRFAVSNMAAGDRATGQLQVENNGTLPLTFTLTSFATATPLRDALDIVAWSVDGACTAVPPGSAELWRPLGGPDTSNPLAVSGALAVGDSQLICMSAQLPIDIGPSAQGQRMDLLIGVNAIHDIEATEAER